VAASIMPSLFSFLLLIIGATSMASRAGLPACEPMEAEPCPNGWKHVGSLLGYCSASEYEGPCRPLISDSELERIGKQQFMLTCGVDWPCQTTQKESFVTDAEQSEATVTLQATHTSKQQTGPAFPEGIAELVNGVKQSTEQIDKPDTNEPALLKELEDYGEAGLTDDLNEEKAQVDLEKAAYAAVHLRLLKLKYSGGCPRTFSGCPIEWSATSEGMCTPPESYEGVCGAFSAELSPSLKEDVAWKCQSSWPCAAPCDKSYSGCPAQWTNVGSLCIAPGGYDGICSPAMDFSSFSTEQKAAWSAKCGAPWSCASSEA